MSTKSTLVNGKGFRLFEECFEEDAVYLELEKTEFVASNLQEISDYRLGDISYTRSHGIYGFKM